MSGNESGSFPETDLRFIVNGRFVDPMKVKLPRGRVLENTMLAGFEQERTRLESMLTRATPSRYAQGR